VPDVTTPKATTAWALVLIAAIVLWLILVLPLVRSSGPAAARPEQGLSFCTVGS
jgi:hypothetical protein